MSIPTWAKRTVLAMTISTLTPIVAPAVVTHAQAVTPPANFVSVAGDGWTVMAPPDWTPTAQGKGVQQLKGVLPNGATGAFTVLKLAGAPADYTLQTLASEFKTTDLMKDATWGGEEPNTWNDQPTIDGSYTQPTGGGFYRLMLTGNTAWALIGTVFTQDAATMSSGLDGITPIIGTFSFTK